MEFGQINPQRKSFFSYKHRLITSVYDMEFWLSSPSGSFARYDKYQNLFYEIKYKIYCENNVVND